MVDVHELNAMHVCEEAMDGGCMCSSYVCEEALHGECVWRSYGECA